ncbi:E3 ubiquitin-protein ligase KCMF1 isoform X3 [Ixodes scapularis]|uniref:E3 ubiquitin-protein ligase KCMF1 isoform X3 n=1 Tax=Ixodes scapularis TaxID=6945 RepID=UPI001A9E155E|nr:E3 ubiquitin-protein ligase KCMF1 isoform X3 [Ixodes scapularis]
MSRHEGVSCDSCLKGNFRGKRYKCLICYDYDLCGTCYEVGATSTRHTPDHAMQCILTRSDFDLYYGGEAVSVEQPQSFTCPICGKMGFTEMTLQEHVAAEHTDASSEVVCPVCAALPGGEPNHVTEDFAAHLSLEHRSNRELDEPSGSRHVRRIPHPAGRGMSSARARRSQMQFSSTGGLSALSPSNRDSMDPIAELLSQLSSGVRRTATLAQPSTTSQIQQLQMQLQLERQQAQAARQQLERLPRRQAHLAPSTQAAPTTTGPSLHAHCPPTLEPPAVHFLLSRCVELCLQDADQQALELERADRSLFAQELLLTTLSEQVDQKQQHLWTPHDNAWWGVPAQALALGWSVGNGPSSSAELSSSTTPTPAAGPALAAPPASAATPAPSTGPAQETACRAQQPSRASRNATNEQHRAGSREGRLSPSRRKVVRVLDERNRLGEPPH